MREPIVKKTFAFLLPVALLVAVAPAAAEPVGGLEPTRVNVAYGDLDLATDAGAATLAVRVRSAIKRACPELTRDLRQQAVARKCRSAAAENAKAASEVAIAAARAGSPRLASGGDRAKAALQK
jgi:UrcA family protein